MKDATSPLRWVFVVAPILVILVTGAGLMNEWSERSQRTPGELGENSTSPVPDEPKAVADLESEAARVESQVGSFDPRWVAVLVASADIEAGANSFRICLACHACSPDAAHKIGPNLWGTMGRAKASSPGYLYSEALKSKGGNWTGEDLAAYLHDPRSFAPGTRMAFAGIMDGQEIANIIAYLATQFGAPKD